MILSGPGFERAKEGVGMSKGGVIPDDPIPIAAAATIMEEEEEPTGGHPPSPPLS